MLRLVRKCSRPLRALSSLESRGFGAAPCQAPKSAAEERKKQIVYYDRINRKQPMVSQGEVDSTTRFLMDRGFTQLQALKAISLHVALTYYTVEMMEGKIQWLHDLGLSHDKINVVIQRHPNILGIAFDKYEALADWYISKGVSKTKLPYLFNVFPQAVSYSIATNLEPKVNFLKEIGCSDKQITSVLMLAPQIFSNSVEGLRAKTNYLVELGISRELLPSIVARVPQCLGMKSSRVKETLDALDEMFGAGAGIRALTWNCIIVMYNIDRMRASLDYLISLGFTRERIEKNTRYITRNAERVIRPRSQFLLAKGHKITENLSWILMPEALFIQKYPDYEDYVAEYTATQEQSNNASQDTARRKSLVSVIHTSNSGAV